MLDVFNITDNSPFNQVFYTKGTTDWQVWNKPSNAKMVYILCMGSGSGGGAGQNGTVSTTRRGGGGGASAGYTAGFFSATQLPDTLYVQVGPGGVGGIGGATSSSGGAGALSYVSIQPNTTALNILMQSGAAAATAGVNGPSGGTGGTAGTVWTGSALSDLGLVVAYAGQTGGNGQTNTIPTAITIGDITSAGPGGAGTNLSVVFNGGDITGAGFVPTLPGGASSSAANAGDGSGGFSTLNPVVNTPARNQLIFTGGSSGGSSNSAAGGNGGNGAFGSGGGGGGVGVTGSAGNGGKGGDGLVIITCF